jgi:hypothetical protein
MTTLQSADTQRENPNATRAQSAEPTCVLQGKIRIAQSVQYGEGSRSLTATEESPQQRGVASFKLNDEGKSSPRPRAICSAQVKLNITIPATQHHDEKKVQQEPFKCGHLEESRDKDETGARTAHISAPCMCRSHLHQNPTVAEPSTDVCKS